MAETQNTALWGGRFTEAIADIAHRFSSSIEVDGQLYREDITGSIAHARMLGSVGVLSEAETAQIVAGLTEILDAIEAGALQFDRSMEDVHLAIEKWLIERIGPVGGKLHTGRSRNDQVATDVRLYARRAASEIVVSLLGLIEALLDKAEQHQATIMPGYTHMQRAQPVLLGHHLMAYIEMFGRDVERMEDAASRINRSPLGSAAFAGTPYPLDRHLSASELQFDSVLANSMDAVSDRDHLIELVSACSIVMMHLSRMAEELVLWSTKEFAFVTMSDAVTTGSSIMPQKKNPDMAELIRGKVGRVYGSLVNLLTIMKGLPMSYNRDMQEDKQPLLDAVQTTRDSLEMMAFMLRETQFNAARMEREVQQDLLTATEIADYLASRGIPFREAHHITGRIVAYSIEQNVPLAEIALEEYRSFSPLFEESIFVALDPKTSVAAKRSFGSTNPEMVKAAIEAWRMKLAGDVAGSEAP